MSCCDSNDYEYDSGPYCAGGHWSDPSECDEICAECGAECSAHHDQFIGGRWVDAVDCVFKGKPTPPRAMRVFQPIVQAPPPKLPERAKTPEAKRLIIEYLYTCWERYPELRLGQLLDTVFGVKDPFYIEDSDLESAIKAQISRSI